MRRPTKIDNAEKKRFAGQEKMRPVGSRVKQLYFLIVCEGEKNGTKLLSSAKKILPVGTVDVQMEVEGAARN